MKKLHKRKGVFTIEATLLIPILLLIFMLFLDIVYLTFVKTSAKSKLELANLQSQAAMAELTNDDFNALRTGAKNTNDYINNKLKRSVFDEMNFEIESNSFTKRACLNLLPAMQNKQNWLKSVDANNNSSLAFYSFNINYNFNFNSFLSKFYQKSNLKANQMQGSIQFKDQRIFDQIVSIDTVYSFIENSGMPQKIAEDFQKAVDKMKQK